MPDPAQSAPAPAPSTDPLTTESLTLSLGKGKNVVLGGGAATGLGGLAWVIFQLFTMHNEAMAKIASVEANIAVLNSKFDDFVDGRVEIKQDLRELRNDLDYIARNGSRPMSMSLPSQRDFDGDPTRDSLVVKRGAGGQATP